MIYWHQERNHQDMANSPTMQGVFGFLMSSIGTRLKTVWAGKLSWNWKLDLKFKSQLHRNFFQSITDVIRPYGCVVMWIQDLEDDTVVENRGVDAMYSAVTSMIHDIRTEDKEAKKDAVHRTTGISKHWMIESFSGLKLATGKPLLWIPKENAYLIFPEWIED